MFFHKTNKFLNTIHSEIKILTMTKKTPQIFLMLSGSEKLKLQMKEIWLSWGEGGRVVSKTMIYNIHVETKWRGNNFGFEIFFFKLQDKEESCM